MNEKRVITFRRLKQFCDYMDDYGGCLYSYNVNDEKIPKCCESKCPFFKSLPLFTDFAKRKTIVNV